MGFVWSEVQRNGSYADSEVAAIASIVADQVAPAFSLSDPKGAHEILSSLRAEEQIRDAVLYHANAARFDRGHSCFAAFHHIPSTTCPPLRLDGTSRTSDTVTITRTVTAGGERVGTLVVTMGVPSLGEVIVSCLGTAGIIVVFSLVVAGVVAVFLQSRVSRPILDIAQVAQRIAQTHRYQDRVAVTASGELGVLAGSFNAMIDEIERRDVELAQHRRSLEGEVAERNQVNAELRLAKEKAEGAARQKSEFLANMSHEIRTPLNGVLGMIGLVLDKPWDPEARQQLSDAQRAAQALVAILNDILDLSKMEAGKLRLDEIDFDLRETLQEVLRMFDIAFREKQLELAVAVLKCPRWVHGDPIRLRQVLINLVGNAVKFTPSGAVIVTVTAAENGWLRFDIADSGIGVPPDKLHSIFEPFTQADGSHTRRFGGTGLGLTITRRLVDLMSGRLSVESKMGRCSCFSIELPLAPGTEPVLAENDAVLPLLPDSLLVLVAEDNPINQKVIRVMLQRQGWTVEVAGTGKEAYESFLRGQFDLVLMDVQMPEVDGLEATRLIRQAESQSKAERTPIVALTAHATAAQQEQCLAAGMDGVITKPVNFKTLLRQLGPMLGTRALVDD
jgi:signal transduction histidine kinase/CheY-like chemotaxis protein